MEIIANMELNKKVEVEILHVENPNKFWFRTKSDARDLDKAVSLYVSANSAKNSYTPKVDDVIVAKINCRWEIAHVKSKDNFIVISIVGKQKIWKITQKDAFLLNDRSLIDMAVKTIQLGSISGIDPGEKVCFHFREYSLCIKILCNIVIMTKRTNVKNVGNQ